MEVVDQEDAVPGRDTEHREEPDQRSRRDTPPLAYAASTPPTSANGIVANDSVATRQPGVRP
jgi:hypothetical protein